MKLITYLSITILNAELGRLWPREGYRKPVDASNVRPFVVAILRVTHVQQQFFGWNIGNDDNIKIFNYSEFALVIYITYGSYQFSSSSVTFAMRYTKKQLTRSSCYRFVSNYTASVLMDNYLAKGILTIFIDFE